MRHTIDENVTNSEIRRAIDEYCRRDRDREILARKWIDGWTFDEIANEYLLSPQMVKKIVYGVGDSILLRINKNA